MKITDILSKDSVIADLTSDSKKNLLEELATLASKETGLDSRVILDALVERERLGSTGVGRGVALPHTRLLGLDKIFCAFVRTNPVDFEAVDGKLVDLVFLLLVPEESGADHLKALSCLSKLLRDETVTAALRKASNVDEIYQIICENDTL
ncbi:MAG: PTS IIA-like nitrogen regulatory protein PtsN [Alphaproteobacteria bacterium]|nr:PTS IIA-like nitrogen regulatory protein PtsN [Alphaproteobacteria bacterium]MBR6730551.1 PTS IIA-like nitrogen regulatory protein PtsN [Alphaproteobacteria bacterium]